ncbi:MAG: PDZ domain-containing protein [Planctomycetota bacterium]|nr:PDZ domain-containing protein [Planctomycetota bacterium]
MRFALTLRSVTVLAVVVCFAAGRPAVSQSFLDRVEQRTRETILTPAGKARGFLGLRADDFGQQGRGVRVTLVHPGGAADRAGVEVDDLVLAVGQRPVIDLDSLSSLLESKIAGDLVKLQIKRENQRLEVEVTLASRLGAGGPADQQVDVPESVPPPPPGAANERPRAALGVTVESLTESGKQKRGVQRGVLVTEVRKGSAAERSGLKVDAVILSADGVDLQRAADLEQLVQQSRPGDSLQLLWRIGQEYLRREVTLLSRPVVRRPRSGGGATTTDVTAGQREDLPQQPGVLPGARRPVRADVRRADPESLQLQLQALMIELRALQLRLQEVERQLQEVSPGPRAPRPAPERLPSPADS